MLLKKRQRVGCGLVDVHCLISTSRWSSSTRRIFCVLLSIFRIADRRALSASNPIDARRHYI
ncbi:MAG TPA: hypothetical protein VIY30_18420 [Burkholderiaceae bacterium]